MTLSICTWNINSVRLRESLVLRLMETERPDVLCLQETKTPADKFPLEAFAAAGYPHAAVRGNKGHCGVAILSRVPMEDAGSMDFCGRDDARHVSARLEDGTLVHNLYVPSGGDEPDPDANPKFAHKLDFVAEMATRFEGAMGRQVLVGDLNIAPREDDVWSHRQLLKVVSHTPVEVEAMIRAQRAGAWDDAVRRHIPDGKLYSWWSYRGRDWSASDRGRRLDHIWVTPGVETASARILREVRGWDRPSDHVPVIVEIR